MVQKKLRQKAQVLAVDLETEKEPMTRKIEKTPKAKPKTMTLPALL